MPVTSTDNRVSYSGDGVTVAFAVTYVFLLATDLKVYLTDAAGVETLQTITTDYTVSGGDGSTGTVTFVTAPAATETVTIIRDPPLTQLSDFEDGGSFPADTFDKALDKAAMIMQRLSERIDRSIELAETAVSGSGSYDFDGNKISNVGDPTADQDAATKIWVETLAALVSNLGADESFLAIQASGVTGTADAITLTDSHFPSTPTALVKARFTPEANNTGNVDVTVTDGASPWAAKNLLDLAGSELAANTLVTGVPVEIVYSSIDDCFYLLDFTDTSSFITSSEAVDTLGLDNVGLAVSVAAGAITIALKGADGNDPSSSNVVRVSFRSATATSGVSNKRTATAAKSMTVTNLATLGVGSSETRRIYVAGIEDGSGGFDLAVWNPLSGVDLKALDESALHTSTAEGDDGSADSAQVLYSESVRTSQPIRILGYFEIQSGATAGDWTSAPTKVQVMGPGVPRTGDIVQEVADIDGAVATGTTAIPLDDTIPQITEGDQFMSVAMTAISALNLVEIEADALHELSTTVDVAGALFESNSTGALAVKVAFMANATDHFISLSLSTRIVVPSASATTYSYRAGTGSTETVGFNGNNAGTRFFGGAANSALRVREIHA